MATLCRQLSVTYETLPGQTKRDKAREFLDYVERRGRMTGLTEVLVALRPDLSRPIAALFEAGDAELDWLDQLAPADDGSRESALTWRWPTATASQPTGAKSQTRPAAPPNPYTPGIRVADDAMFFGRVAERDFLRERLNERSHVAIVGGRGLGGSSLLWRMMSQLAEEDRALPAAIDMKDPAHQTLAGLLGAVWTQWWARVKPGNVAPIQNLAEFVTAARKLNAAGYRPLLLLDELEQLVWRPDVFQDSLFDAWLELGREKLVSFAITGHSSPADVLAQGGSSSRFYELFQQLDLGLLDPQPARDLLTVPVGRAGLTLPPGAVDSLLKLAGPHPFYLHLAGLYLFDALARDAYSGPQVAACFEAAAAPFWQELWDSLSPLAQSYYPQAQIRETNGMAARQMRLLGNKGLVAIDDAGFRPFSDGFAGWLRRHQAAAEAAAAVYVT